MDKIENIKRIKVDLLKLKPIQDQKNVYSSYKKFLDKYFNKGLPDRTFFENTNCTLCNSNNEDTLVTIDFFEYKKCSCVV